MPEIKKAIIIGAGPAGVAAALRLTQHNNIQCTVYEIRPEPTTLGGAVGISSNGLRLLHRLGVHDALTARGSTASKFVLHSTQDSILAEADMVHSAREKTGFGYVRIKRTDLMAVLLETAREKDIPVHFGKRMVSIDEDAAGVSVTFDDGTADTADLLLGCDGIHSAVRTLHVDPQCSPEYSGFAAEFSILPASALPATAPRLEGLNATLTSEGLFAVMPCTAAGDELFWFFSQEVPIPESGDTRDGWEEHRQKEVDGFKTALLEILKDVHGDWGDVLKEMVNQTSTVSFYPVYRLPLGRKWSKGRCLVIGDAAHAMQPHAGQGVSMAVEDVFLLSRLLKQYSTSPLDEVFEKFEQVRRPRINRIYETAARNGNRRRKTGPWALWFKELAIWGGFLVLKAFGGQKGVVSHDDLIYDIDEAQI